MPNEATPLVSEYLRYKTLAKLGFRFDGNSLTDFQVDYLTSIHSQFSAIEREEMGKKHTSTKRK